MQTLIKFCGITRASDALHAAELGVDALGFNFYSQSPRYLEAEIARSIVDSLPPHIMQVGVFVNHSRDEIEAIVRTAGLDAIQLHGDETVEDCKGWGELTTIKASRLGVGRPVDVSAYAEVVDYLLFDSFQLDAYGGTGEQIPESVLESLELDSIRSKLLISGGLTADTVSSKLSLLSPRGVDVASGIESAPGVKDLELMKRFVDEVRKGS